jgi:hypothetical protein
VGFVREGWPHKVRMTAGPDSHNARGSSLEEPAQAVGDLRGADAGGEHEIRAGP